MAQRLGQAQPSVGYPQGAVSFLRALVAPDTAALGVWATTARPDAHWAEWLRRSAIGCRLPFTDCTPGRPAGAPVPRNSAGRLRGMYYNAAGEADAAHTRAGGCAWTVLIAAGGHIPVLFKGAVLAYTAYPDPACRPMGDLDLWIALEAMPPAQAALESLGYAQHLQGGTSGGFAGPARAVRSSCWAARRAAA